LEWIDATDRTEKRYIEKPNFTFEDAKYNLKNIGEHRAESNLKEFFK